MKDQEVNKIITEFMGWNLWSGQFSGIKYNAEIYIDENGKKVLNNFTESLDALVPVWEKLELFGINLRFDKPKDDYTGRSHYYLIDSHGDEYYRNFDNIESKTIQQAAAHATARAILESKK